MPGINRNIGLSKVRQGSNSSVPTEETIPIPAAFPNPYALEIKRTGSVAYITNKSIDDFKRVVSFPVVNYFDSLKGHDTND